MRDSTTIFDQESDAREESDAALTREFWGDQASWVGTGRRSVFQVQRADETAPPLSLDYTPTSLAAIRDGIAAFRPKRRRADEAGPVERTREHGIVRPAAAMPTAAAVMATPASPLAPKRPSPDRLAHRDASIGELASGRFDGAPYPRTDGSRTPAGEVPLEAVDERTSEYDLIPLTPTGESGGLLGTLDPTVVRLVLVVLAVVLALPLALALRGGDSPDGGVNPDTNIAPLDVTDGAATPAKGGSSPATAASGAPLTEEASASAPADDDTHLEPASTPGGSVDAQNPEATTPLTEAYDDSSADVAVDEAPASVATESETAPDPTVAAAAQPVATVAEEADRDVPDCSRTYTAGPGDSWYRMADEAGVAPSELLAQNRSTLDSVILPGAEICLPPGAAMPSPPTTVVTTAAPTTAAPKAVAPTTTEAPTTTAAPALPSYTQDEVKALIREIWPDELEERALEIARRESKYHATADNGSCCVGVFQIYWTVHDGWLDDYGIHSRNDLKDARKNITAAYALYQRSGGWGPWGG